jgi:hypothetical protein
MDDKSAAISVVAPDAVAVAVQIKHVRSHDADSPGVVGTVPRAATTVVVPRLRPQAPALRMALLLAVGCARPVRRRHERRGDGNAEVAALDLHLRPPCWRGPLRIRQCAHRRIDCGCTLVDRPGPLTHRRGARAPRTAEAVRGARALRRAPADRASRSHACRHGRCVARGRLLRMIGAGRVGLVSQATMRLNIWIFQSLARFLSL